MARGTFLSRSGTILVTALATAAVVACGSLPDLHFADGDGGVAGGDGGGDVVVGVDGGDAAIPPACKSGGPEICNDGVDNDCNLLVDCKDSACTGSGFACEAVPSGWTAVSFSATARPSCHAGETAIDLKVAADDSVGTCTCSCTSVGGNCGAGNFTVKSSSEATCSVTPTTTTVPVNNGACTPLGASISLSTLGAIVPPTGPTSCIATSALNGALTNGRLCQPQGIGGGCAAGEVCAAGAAGGLASCVTKAGKSACPADFPNRSTAGTDATDTRTCGGCACGAPTACAAGTVSLYDNVMCKTNGMFKGAEGIAPTCASLAPASQFTATHFKSTPPTGGCGAPTSQATVTGGVAFMDERTVCCK